MNGTHEQEQGIPFTQLARDQEDAFLNDMARLHVLPPNAITRVSEHMDDIIRYIEQIQKNGFAYEATDGSGVYFRTQELGSKYGKLDPMRTSGVSAAEDQPEAVADEEEDGTPTSIKEDRRDFALWKATKEPGEPFWDSPWGKGRPGWHIECSAMTHHVLGDRLDVHSGGIDLKFPHHNNEIAQCDAHNEQTSSCCGHNHANAREWCAHFVHFGHLYIRGLKMSKSLKNFISVREFLEHHSADEFRVFCLQFKYRANLHYSEDRVRDAVVTTDRIKSFFRSVHAYNTDSTGKANATSKRCEEQDLQLLSTLFATRAGVDSALMNDFDTPQALQLVLDLLARTNEYALSRQQRGEASPSEVLWSVTTYVLEMLSLFGLDGLHAEFAHVQHGFMLHSAAATASTRQAQQSSDTHGLSGEEMLRSLVRFRAAVREQALLDPRAASNAQILKICDELRNNELPPLGVLVEDLAPGRSIFKQISPEEYAADQAAAAAAAAQASEKADQLRAKQLEYEQLMQIAPVDFFRASAEYQSKYTAFDEQGVPTHDDKNEELSKSQRKKLLKKHEKHIKAYEKYWSDKD